MDYQDYLQQVAPLAEQELQKIYPEAHVEIREVQKYNHSYTGLVPILPFEGEMLAPCLDLTQIYETSGAWKQDGIVEQAPAELIGMMVTGIEKAKDHRESLEIFIGDDFDRVRSNLGVVVRGIAGNEDYLKGRPYDRMGDLAVLYTMHVTVGGDRGMVVITNDMMRHYGINHEQLREAALVNAVVQRPPAMTGIMNAIDSLRGDPSSEFSGGIPETAPMSESLFTVSCLREHGLSDNGAGVIAYPGLFDQIRSSLGEDFCILPSSIHEVLVVRDSMAREIGVEQLEDLVKTVNETQVDPREQLSDHVYHYDGEERKFELIRDYTARNRSWETLSENGPVREEPTKGMDRHPRLDYDPNR